MPDLHRFHEISKGVAIGKKEEIRRAVEWQEGEKPLATFITAKWNLFGIKSKPLLQEGYDHDDDDENTLKKQLFFILSIAGIL